MKVLKTWEDIKNHPLINAKECVRDYDGKGKHMVVCVDGYEFEANNSTIEIGNIKELCYEVNSRLQKREFNP